MKRKAQSEMVGFGLIIIIVAVLLLIFLSISFKKSNEEFTQSYEVESFIQSVLQVSTDCEMDYSYNYRDVRELFLDCRDNESCYGGRNSCEVLNETLSEILDYSFVVDNDSYIKGYTFNSTIEGNGLLGFEKGNITNIRQGASQAFSDGLDIIFIIYN